METRNIWSNGSPCEPAMLVKFSPSTSNLKCWIKKWSSTQWRDCIGEDTTWSFRDRSGSEKSLNLRRSFGKSFSSDRARGTKWMIRVVRGKKSSSTEQGAGKWKHQRVHKWLDAIRIGTCLFTFCAQDDAFFCCFNANSDWYFLKKGCDVIWILAISSVKQEYVLSFIPLIYTQT
jgi:hypothetical protein